MATFQSAIEPWILDSGETHHLTTNLDHMAAYSKYIGPEEIRISNGTKLPINRVGNSHLHVNGRLPSAT